MTDTAAREDLTTDEARVALAALIEREGLTIAATFVPFSQSRNASGDQQQDGKPWRSLNWVVFVRRQGRDVNTGAPAGPVLDILQTTYAQGEGHAPAYKKTAAQKETAARVMGRPVKVTLRIMLDHEIETGRIAQSYSWSSGVSSGKPIPAPEAVDVLASLFMDSSVIDAPGFEDWAREYGYDTDSRSAEATYRQCLEHALKLRAALGDTAMTEARDLAHQL